MEEFISSRGVGLISISSRYLQIMMLVEASITEYPKAAAGHVLVDWLFCAYNSCLLGCVCSNVRIMLSIINDEMDVMSFLFSIS